MQIIPSAYLCLFGWIVNIILGVAYIATYITTNILLLISVVKEDFPDGAVKQRGTNTSIPTQNQDKDVSFEKKIEKLTEMKNNGLLTEEEFSAMKKKCVDDYLNS